MRDIEKKLLSNNLKVSKAASIKNAKEFSSRSEKSEKTDGNAPETADAPAEKKIRTNKVPSEKKIRTNKVPSEKKIRTNKVSSPKAKVTVADKSSVSAILTRKEPEPAVKEEPAKAPETTAAEPEKKTPGIAEPAFITNSIVQTPTSEKKTHNLKWALILPAIIVLLCLALFVVASQAGWIQTFLTPETKRIVMETTTEETTPEPETTTQPPTTTVEETTEETTTEFVPSYYVIYVNLAYNRVTVYERGEKLNDGADPEDPLDDEYDLIPHIAFTCSPGLDGATPTGVYYLQNRAAWCEMIHDVYTQYATRIVDDVMFHSIPYLSENPGDLATYDYNILGQDASSACIRLNCRDAYWIYNYCAQDTEVDIFYDWTWPGPIEPEPIYRIPENWGELSRWDPTDIYSGGNPWMNYEAALMTTDVTVPMYSSVDRLIAAFAPHDNYGNALGAYFYTDGNYNLDLPGTYYPVGYITVANQSFAFQLSITVTEEIADEYYNGGVYDDGYDDEDFYSEDDYSEDDYYGDDYSEDDYSEDDYSEDDYSEDDYSEDGYYENDYSEDTYSEDTYSEDTYSEDTYEDGGYYEEDADYQSYDDSGENWDDTAW
ncbi:MAG: L,D-transpeptidase family protein [Parasporobacterium sp.]|nr:L,D-transpeptidase family protein [Parasporobacterium sp.]